MYERINFEKKLVKNLENQNFFWSILFEKL